MGSSSHLYHVVQMSLNHRTVLFLFIFFIFDYEQQIKTYLKRIHISGCRFNERLNIHSGPIRGRMTDTDGSRETLHPSSGADGMGGPTPPSVILTSPSIRRTGHKRHETTCLRSSEQKL